MEIGTTDNGKLNILIAEDERINQLYLKELLKTVGHSVACAANGRDAVELFKENRFDVVFLDIQMPVMDGIEAVRKMRELESLNTRPRARIVALTAYSLSGDRERLLESGMDDYLAKPVSEAQLLEVLTIKKGRPE